MKKPARSYHKIRKIGSIEDVRGLLIENKIKIFGVGPYPSTRSEIWPFVPNYEIICANKTGEFYSVREKIRVNVLSEGKKPYPSQKPERILSRREAISYIKKVAGGRRIGLYYYGPDRDIDQICQNNNWTAIANPASVFEKFDDKLEFLKILHAIGVKRNSLVIKTEELEKRLPSLFSKLGEKIVIQFPKEGGGRGTFFFHEKEKRRIPLFIQKMARSSEIGDAPSVLIASSFVAGPSLSISGCITKDNGILASSCRYQLIDIKETTKIGFSGVFCGNDWSLSQKIPESIHRKAHGIALKIGKVLKTEGAKGIFGVDFIWNKEKNTLVPLEINPRLLGTTPVSAQTHLIKKEIPLEAFHVLEFLEIKYLIGSKKSYLKNFTYSGAHLIIYNQSGKSLRCTRKVTGGVYKLVHNKLHYVREGFELSDIRKKNEFILTDGVPTNKYTYKKNRKLFRIITLKKISRNDGKELNIWGKNLVRASYSHFNFQSVKEIKWKS